MNSHSAKKNYVQGLSADNGKGTGDRGDMDRAVGMFGSVDHKGADGPGAEEGRQLQLARQRQGKGPSLGSNDDAAYQNGSDGAAAQHV